MKQENETVSVDGVNGPAIILGSLTDVSENGNWPSIFDASCNNKKLTQTSELSILVS